MKPITALAATAALGLAIGAAPAQAATPAKAGASLSARQLAKLPLTNRDLTAREKANLAVVLQAYHDGEGDSLDPQGFMETVRSRRCAQRHRRCGRPAEL